MNILDNFFQILRLSYQLALPLRSIIKQEKI